MPARAGVRQPRHRQGQQFLLRFLLSRMAWLGGPSGQAVVNTDPLSGV